MKTVLNNHKNLVKALKSGDESAYKFLFTHYYSDLLYYASGLTNNKDKAADIVQETFINMWKKRATIEINTSIKNYLFSTVYHHFIDAYRKEKSRLELLDQLRSEALLERIDLQENDQKERLQQIKKIISKLPVKCKEIFLLSKKEGLRYQEIGDTLNISVKTVEAQMSKAFRTIRENFEI